MKTLRPGSHRLREFRASPITAPEREFVFQVVNDTVPRAGIGYQTRVYSNARVTVREDPQRPGRVLVTAWGDNIRVVWRRDE